jgi:hypothetical protein
MERFESPWMPPLKSREAREETEVEARREYMTAKVQTARETGRSRMAIACRVRSDARALIGLAGCGLPEQKQAGAHAGGQRGRQNADLCHAQQATFAESQRANEE